MTGTSSLIGIDLRIIHFAQTGFYRYALGLLHSLSCGGLTDAVTLLVHPAWRRPLSHQGFTTIPVRSELFTKDESAALSEELSMLGIRDIHYPHSLFPAPASGKSMEPRTRDLT